MDTIFALLSVFGIVFAALLLLSPIWWPFFAQMMDIEPEYSDDDEDTRTQEQKERSAAEAEQIYQVRQKVLRQNHEFALKYGRHNIPDPETWHVSGDRPALPGTTEGNARPKRLGDRLRTIYVTDFQGQLPAPKDVPK
jgi:hypothetical protein